MSPRAKELFSVSLNPPKVLQTCDKRFRDWRGFAGALGIGGEANLTITAKPDPTGAIFDLLNTREEKVTFEELLKALEAIDRWDVVDDATDILEKDGTIYLERLEKGYAPEIDIKVDDQMLTYDDQIRYEAGEPMQSYDGFLLYADQDAAFANEIIENLETKGKLRLCTQDRDLISRGERFASDVLMQLISERCTRLIVVLSPNFLRNPVNTFLMSFGLLVGITECRRKIVPVVYQDCAIPQPLQQTVLLRYFEGIHAVFFERLRNCIRTCRPPTISANSEISESPSVNTEVSPEINGDDSEKSEIETPETKIETPETKIETLETKIETPETKIEIPETKIETLETKIETPQKEISPASSLKRVKKNGFFRFYKKKSLRQDETIPQLPSLIGLDDLEEGDIEDKKGKKGDINEKKGKSKSRGGVKKRLKALF